MSASPHNQSTKRPLEETSSPNRNEQPDAKRPALDKMIKDDGEAQLPTPEGEAIIGDSNMASASNENGTNSTNSARTNGADSEVKDVQVQVDTSLPSAPNTKHTTAPIIPMQNTSQNTHDETVWIHVRAVISSPEAATIIGKGGENVSRIRQMSGAKCTVSDYQKGAVERILTVSGVVDATAKAFGLIIRTLNNEPLDQPSNEQSKTYPLRLLVPHMLIGSIIGKGGSRIKEIQEASGARLNASDSCLAGSSERSLVVMGVADAVHIATYYVASTLLEQLNERFGGPAASAYATRSGGPAAAVPGGMQVIPYSPAPAGGHYGNRENYRRHDSRPNMQQNAYQQSGFGHASQQTPAMPVHYGGQPAAGYGSAPHMAPHAGSHAGAQPHAGAHALQSGPIPAGAPLTQQIYIPNDMVGAIIGKGGQKINEIRQVSGSVIKINEPQDSSSERLVTITGTEECNRMALYMLYSRLESEKHRI